jgi:hypothetical protein
MAQRGVIVSYETIHQWCRKFVQNYANGLRRRRARPPHAHAPHEGASKIGPSLHPPLRTEPPSDPGWFISLEGCAHCAVRDSQALASRSEHRAIDRGLTVVLACGVYGFPQDERGGSGYPVASASFVSEPAKPRRSTRRDTRALVTHTLVHGPGVATSLYVVGCRCS